MFKDNLFREVKIDCDKSQKEKLLYILDKTISVIKTQGDGLDVSCLIIQQQGGEYVVDVYEYL
jgi:hypothetical protein